MCCIVLCIVLYVMDSLYVSLCVGYTVCVTVCDGYIVCVTVCDGCTVCFRWKINQDVSVECLIHLFCCVDCFLSR